MHNTHPTFLGGKQNETKQTMPVLPRIEKNCTNREKSRGTYCFAFLPLAAAAALLLVHHGTALLFLLFLVAATTHLHGHVGQFPAGYLSLILLLLLLLLLLLFLLIQEARRWTAQPQGPCPCFFEIAFRHNTANNNSIIIPLLWLLW